jgi:hypothetical protein
MTIDEARNHVGELVIYRPKWDTFTEEGVITSVNDSFIFVRYSESQTSQATYPDDLTLSLDKV